MRLSKLIKSIILATFLSVVYANAQTVDWNSCSPDQECPYPGQCGAYTDTNNDQICDYSQPEPESKIQTQVQKQTQTEIQQKQDKKYIFLPLIIILVFSYIATWSLARKKIITLAAHKKLWNYLLLISFLISGFSGLFLVLKVNYGLIIQWPFNLLYWHVELGIAMAAISVFHIIWHWQYYFSKCRIKIREI
ncbi:MAG: hypothetical protein ABIC19_03515, partial [Patescibacteria group bacterium]